MIYVLFISLLTFCSPAYACLCSKTISQKIQQKCASTQKSNLPISATEKLAIVQEFNRFPRGIVKMILEYLPEEKTSIRRFDVTVPTGSKRHRFKIYPGNVRRLDFFDSCCLQAELVDSTIMVWRIADEKLILDENRSWFIPRVPPSLMGMVMPSTMPQAEHDLYKASVVDYVSPDSQDFSETSGKTVEVTINMKAALSYILGL